jgi:putative transcriptional regulator
MSKKNTIVARRQTDGTLAQVLPDGSTRPLEDKTDWKRLAAMTDEQIQAAALADSDAQPLTDADFERMKRVPRIRTLRRALRLTQEEFAARYHIPIGTLRDWEQGRCEPDQPARAYLTVIAHDPQGVIRALEHIPMTDDEIYTKYCGDGKSNHELLDEARKRGILPEKYARERAEKQRDETIYTDAEQQILEQAIANKIRRAVVRAE